MQFILGIVCAFFLFSGCDEEDEKPNPDWQVRITANCGWSGFFDNRSVDGTGDTIVDVSNGSIVCATVQKTVAFGTLTASMYDGINNHEADRATTTAEFGVVSVCN